MILELRLTNLPHRLSRWQRLRDRWLGAWRGSEVFPAVVMGGLFWLVLGLLLVLIVRSWPW